jgi:hypothetical protein
MKCRYVGGKYMHFMTANNVNRCHIIQSDEEWIIMVSGRDIGPKRAWVIMAEGRMVVGPGYSMVMIVGQRMGEVKSRNVECLKTPTPHATNADIGDKTTRGKNTCRV